MEFIKNIKKEFVLNKNVDFIKNNYHYIFDKNTKIHYGKIKVKVEDLNMKVVTFKIVDIENIDDVVLQVLDILINNITKDVKKYKTIAKKLIKIWDKTPENFIRKNDTTHKVVFKNNNALNEKEYSHSTFVFFDNISYHSNFGFTTGCGNNTYYDKEFYDKSLEDIDIFLTKTVKELGSAKIKKRIKNYILKNTIEVSLNDIDKCVTLINSETINNLKPKFPIELKADDLNNILNQYGHQFVIDEEVINECTSDISKLLNWEIQIENESGYHHHDGDVCDYTVVFMSPDGVEYFAYNSHSLMTGWNFYDVINII